MYRYSIAVRMRTGSLCACALGTRVQYNLLQFIWALQSSSTELPASSNEKALACRVSGTIPLSGHNFFLNFVLFSVGFHNNFSVAICHLFSLTSASVIICVFWSYNFLFSWPNMLTSLYYARCDVWTVKMPPANMLTVQSIENSRMIFIF